MDVLLINNYLKLILVCRAFNLWSIYFSNVWVLNERLKRYELFCSMGTGKIWGERNNSGKMENNSGRKFDKKRWKCDQIMCFCWLF